MKKMNTKSFTMVVLLLVIVGLGYYTHLNNQTNKKNEKSSPSEKQQLLEYDFEKNYPKTVRETVKLHCKYLKNAYNGKFEEDELYTVNSNIRQLFDEELLAYNSEEQQLQGLKTDIALYKDKKQKFTGYSLEEASQIQYNTEDGREYAKTAVTLNFSISSTAVSVEQEYLLRKDNDGKWKILGWQTVEPASGKTEGDVK